MSSARAAPAKSPTAAKKPHPKQQRAPKRAPKTPSTSAASKRPPVQPQHHRHAASTPPTHLASHTSNHRAPGDADKREAPTPKQSGFAVGPGPGAGHRRVKAESAGSARHKPSSGSSPKHAKSALPSKPAKPHPLRHRGRPPRHPSATLPPGAPHAEPDEAARHQVAGGETDDDLRAGTSDPQLAALREADKVLFPKPLEGATPGWSWDLPHPVDSDRARVVASGLPPGGRMNPGRGAQLSAADAAWLHSLTMPDFSVPLDARVVKYLKFYRDTSRGQAIARVWAKKSGRYAPAIKAELAKAGLPTDLVWLSLIESGHNPTIVSPAGAAGLWQFVPAAGRLYGLTIDRWVDERLDPARSTEAAVRYLSDLHRRFGNWELAMAAYNMGYGGLTRAIRKFNTNDFWELSRYEAGIPWETTLYVPKILATAIVMNNRKAFGLDGITPDPPVRFDTVLVQPGVSLDQVARAADVSPSTITALNPDYLAGRTPPARPGEHGRLWPVHVPAKTGPGASRRLLRHSGVDPSLKSYVVRFGDTIESIAAARGVSRHELSRINHIASHEEIAQGSVILVPRRPPAPAVTDSKANRVVVVAPRESDYPGRKRVFYRVLDGDTLGRIARAFSVTRSDLQAWNALDPSARLQSGMVLQVFVGRGTDLQHVRHVDADRARVLVAGSREFFNYFEARKGKRRLLVTVKRGDTLSSIGKHYGLSVGSLERINRFSRHKVLQIGETVVVYAKRSRAKEELDGTGDGVMEKPLSPIKAPRPDALPVVDSASVKSPRSGAGATTG